MTCVAAAAGAEPPSASSKTPEKGAKTETPKPAPQFERESDGFDVIPGAGFGRAHAGIPESAYRAVRSAQLHLKFGAAEHGNVAAFEAARQLLDTAAARLAEATPHTPQQNTALETISKLKREAAGLQSVAATTLFGRFPLIRAFGLETEEMEKEFEVHSYTMPGDARRRAIRDALVKIGKSASSDPLHVLILVPGDSAAQRLSSRLAQLVDSEAHEAFTPVPNLKLYPGALRADVDPMPEWDAPDPAFAPICRQFLQRIGLKKIPRGIMLVLVREFDEESPDGFWVQAQQRTFEAETLEDLKEKPEKLAADKVRVSESLTRNQSHFRLGSLAAIGLLFVVALLLHGALSPMFGPQSGDWQKWLAMPLAGFLIGLSLTPLLMLALARWLPDPQTHALSGAWWPCTAGALSLILPAGVFRLGAGSAGRYVPSVSCHGRWGISFVPVALGVCAAWIRPACYAVGPHCVHVITALAVAAALLVYCFGRAIDLADHFPVALAPIALVLALVFGAGAFLGSPLVLWLVSALAGLTTSFHTLIARRETRAPERDDGRQWAAGLGGRRPRTVEQLHIALEMPQYQPPPELERLRRELEHSGLTQSTWLGLVGPSAAGKTAAARHLIAELQSADANVLVLMGRCAEDGAPYHPFREAFTELGLSAGLIAAHARGGEVNSVFERLADEFIPFWDFFSADSDDESEEASRTDLLAAVTNALHAVTRRQHVVLFVDDIQWIDEGSAAVLKHLHENFGPGSESRLTVIVAGRDPLPLERLGLQAFICSLTPPSVAEQIRILDRSLGIEKSSARRLINALGVLSHETGAMFWLIRAVRELASDNAFTPTPRGFVLKSQYLRPGRLPVPAAMRAQLAQALRASGQYQPVLECAALLGEKFRVDELAECLSLDRLKLLQILRHLDQELQLVRDLPHDPDCYAFSSTFMLETVREELGVGRVRSQLKTVPSKIAREWHARIASVLEQREPRTSQLAYRIAQHYFAAGAAYAAQSMTHCLAAARIARKQRAFPDARRYLLMAEQSARLAQKTGDFAAERRRIDADEAQLTPTSTRKIQALPAK